MIDLNKSDWRKAFIFNAYKTRRGKKLIFYYLLSNFVLSFLTISHLWVKEGPIPILYAILIGLFQVIALHSILHVWYWISIIFHKPEKQKGVLGEHTIEIDSNGLRESTEFNDSLQRWTAVDDLLQNEHAVYFFYNNAILTIPKRFFKSTEDCKHFFALADQYRVNAQINH